MMYVNIQHVFDEQNANFDQFNELKTLILSVIPRILNIYQVKKRGEGVNSNKYGTHVFSCNIIPPMNQSLGISKHFFFNFSIKISK